METAVNTRKRSTSERTPQIKVSKMVVKRMHRMKTRLRRQSYLGTLPKIIRLLFFCRQENSITLSGRDIEKFNPVESFATSPFSKELLVGCKNFTKPTPIQGNHLKISLTKKSSMLANHH